MKIVELETVSNDVMYFNVDEIAFFYSTPYREDECTVVRLKHSNMTFNVKIKPEELKKLLSDSSLLRG